MGGPLAGGPAVFSHAPAAFSSFYYGTTVLYGTVLPVQPVVVCTCRY